MPGRNLQIDAIHPEYLAIELRDIVEDDLVEFRFGFRISNCRFQISISVMLPV